MNTEAIVKELNDEIERLQTAVRALRGTATSSPAPTTTPTPRGRRRGMSAEGRARIAAAQRARWAKLKKK